MTAIVLTNFAQSTLAAPIGTGDLSVTVASGEGALFPNPGASQYFYVVMVNTSAQREIVKCTARSGDVMTIVRAQEGTSALPFSAGDLISHRFTAATAATMLSEVEDASMDYALALG